MVIRCAIAVLNVVDVGVLVVIDVVIVTPVDDVAVVDVDVRDIIFVVASVTDVLL